MADTWDYADEQAQMLKRIEALEAFLAALQADHAAFKASVTRMAEYQGVKHFLPPQ